jgi:hypothetical protein
MSRMGRRTGNRMRGSILRPVCVGFALLCAIGGCKSTNNRSDLVEAELRTRDAEVRDLRTALQRSEMLNSALTHPSAMPIAGPPSFTPPPGYTGESVAPSAAVMSGTIKEVSLGRGTGGVNKDGTSGDEALFVVVIPKDTDGSALKVPGNLVVQTSEFTAEGQKVPHCRWDVPSLELQKLWKNGLLATGYHVTLPWKTWPNSPKLRVVVQFTTLGDNRTFEAERDITIRLMPGVPRPATVVPAPPVVPAPASPMSNPKDRPALPDDGPILAPGAWFRQREPAAWIAGVTPMSQPSTSAKLEDREPAKLLEPQVPEE